MARQRHSILDIFHSDTPAATEFRRILNRLERSSTDQHEKSILVTSSTLSEGKSTISGILAISAARKGLKTLLIDSDLRRPTIHNLFLMPKGVGLADILAHGITAKEATIATSLENLDIITAGSTTGHPTNVFDPKAIGVIIEEAKFYYDLIILDSAPIIPVSDPMLLAPEVDGIIIVVKAGKTQKEVVERATDIIGADRSKILGVVLNNIEASLPYYYDESYYGYEYQQNGKQKNKQKNKGNGQPVDNNPAQSKRSSSGKNGQSRGSATGKMRHHR